MDAQATSPTTAEAQTPAASPAAGVDASTEPVTPGFRARGRMRRRLRFLRRARELAYRDLGGLVFEMHRAAQRRDELISAKLATLDRIDSELRALEGALADRGHVTVLREPGVTACPRCAAIHASEDRFCPACGLAIARRADRPIAAAAPVSAPAPALAAQPPAVPTQSPAAPSQPLTVSTQPAAAPAEQPTQVIPAVSPGKPDEPAQGE